MTTKVELQQQIDELRARIEALPDDPPQQWEKEQREKEAREQAERERAERSQSAPEPEPEPVQPAVEQRKETPEPQASVPGAEAGASGIEDHDRNERGTSSMTTTLSDAQRIQIGLEAATRACHDASVSGGWWHNPETGEALDRNRGELLCLIHSEISEAMEAERKGLMDDKLPHRPGAEVELADALIRIFDYAGGLGYDVAGAVLEKMEYNAQRADHKPENRRQAGGKRF